MTIRVLAVAGLMLCAACGGDSAVQTRTIPGEPGLAYDVNGDYIYLLCAGSGSPVVVLESGLGGYHRDWDAVQPELARTTRVCSYDRAGLGFSQLAPKRTTAKEKASDLRDLLSAADVEGPYVLVGHSYGGMLVRVYAAEYAGDVAGVVLLDSSHPDQVKRFLGVLPPRRAGENEALRDLRRDLHFDDLPNPEGVDWTASSDETRVAGPLGDTLLIVVTAGQDEGPPELPAQVRRGIQHAWLEMQDDLARLSTDKVHVIAVHSPHYVMSNLGQPELVIRAIRAVKKAARSNAPLPPCAALFAAPAGKCVASAR